MWKLRKRNDHQRIPVIEQPMPFLSGSFQSKLQLALSFVFRGLMQVHDVHEESTTYTTSWAWRSSSEVSLRTFVTLSDCVINRTRIIYVSRFNAGRVTTNTKKAQRTRRRVPQKAPSQSASYPSPKFWNCIYGSAYSRPRRAPVQSLIIKLSNYRILISTSAH